MEFNTAGLISLQEALDKMRAYVPKKTTQDAESLPLATAAGRITAAPVLSPIFVPPFDNSAMDGYAVRLKICTRARCSRSREKPLPARLFMANGLPEPVSAS